MELFVSYLVIGITRGCIYALIALGYTMVYGIVKLLNFAHGDIMMVGAYTAFFVLMKFSAGLPGVLLAFAIAMAGCALFGVVMEKTCYKPLRNTPRLNALITAIGVSMLVENAAILIPFVGPNPKFYPSLAPQVTDGLKVVTDGIQSAIGVQFSPIQFLVVAVSVLMMLILNYIVTRTRIGKAMRAVSYDMNAAKLMGISVNNVISVTFAIGAGLAATAGTLYALYFTKLEPTMGLMPGLKCFIAAVLGGIGSIPGAMLGSLVIGLVESFTQGYISTLWSDGIVFLILILILFIRPTGIMGKPMREKV
jgi:branched-chain amino acid transport system permease protein